MITPNTGPYDGPTGAASLFPGTVLSTGTEDYYSSSFYFHAGKFAFHDTGVTHLCATNYPPHPPCADTSHSQWSAYRVHDDDLLLFSGGAQLIMRNGDASCSTPYGNAKCYNLQMTSDMPPGPSLVSTYAWVYLFP